MTGTATSTPADPTTVVYDDAHGLALDLHRAPDPATAPVVLYVHGGGFETGDRAQHAEDRLPGLAARGLTIASLDYRLAPDAAHPSPIDDVRAAARYLARHCGDLGLPPGPLGAIGVSAGGYLAAAAALDGPRTGAGAIHAVSPWSAPADLWTTSRRSPLEAGRGIPPLFEENLVPGRPPASLRDIGLVDRDLTGAPPFLLLHGSLDIVIPVGQSRALHDALQRAGVDSVLLEIGGAGHDDPRFDDGVVLDLVATWFRTILATAPGVR